MAGFSNISAVTIPATGINGSVVVGGEASANSFKNDGSFEVMAENVSGNAGDTVTVVFKFNKNPGICASYLGLDMTVTRLNMSQADMF